MFLIYPIGYIDDIQKRKKEALIKLELLEIEESILYIIDVYGI